MKPSNKYIRAATRRKSNFYSRKIKKEDTINGIIANLFF